MYRRGFRDYIVTGINISRANYEYARANIVNLAAVVDILLTLMREKNIVVESIDEAEIYSALREAVCGRGEEGRGQ